jgi:hypothetical protein
VCVCYFMYEYIYKEDKKFMNHISLIFHSEQVMTQLNQ